MERFRRAWLRAVLVARRLRTQVLERPRLGVALLAVVVLAGIGLGGSVLGQGAGAGPTTPSPTASASASSQSPPVGERRGPFRVVRVLDGQTIEVETATGTLSTVRLLGIDAPLLADFGVQSNCSAAAATAALRSMLAGEAVVLENDLAAGAVNEDGQQLAYVYVDDTLVNQALLQGGFVTQYDDGRSYRLEARFLAAEASARDAGLGVWSPGDCVNGAR